MEEIINDTTLAAWVNKLGKFPSFIKRLNPDEYQCDELCKYLRRMKNEAFDSAIIANKKVERWEASPKEKWTYPSDKELYIQEARQEYLDRLNDRIYYARILENVEVWMQAKPPDQKPKPDMNFVAYLIMDEPKKQPFADKLKAQFPGIGGIDLAIILRAMVNENLLRIPKRGRSKLYNSLREFFGWDINSNQAINNGMYGNNDEVTK
jgi:hypothetical protein